jgi:hypothetical protein
MLLIGCSRFHVKENRMGLVNHMSTQWCCCLLLLDETHSETNVKLGAGAGVSSVTIGGASQDHYGGMETSSRSSY